MGKITVKFGGSSLADASQFKKVKDIIFADSARRYVVPSAPGKRFPSDNKITDLLYACYDASSKAGKMSDIFNEIKDRYNSIISELGLDMSLEEEYKIIEQCFIGKAGRDYAASRGEYLNGLILSKYLGFEFIDAAEVIFFKNNGSFDSEHTNAVLSARLEECKNAVIPGFYGAMPNDTIKTFSRGGSDITGAIVARASNASVYENWTDVSGFLIADPRIIDNPKPISTITYRELRELSYMGATVLHEDSIFPVKTAGIPIHIKNTNSPMDKGTVIVTHCKDDDNDNVITGIAGKKGFSVITLEKDMMNEELGFGRKVMEVLESNNLSFEHLPSGIDTMSIVLNDKNLKGNEDSVVSDLMTSVHPDTINIEKNIALIAVVGRGMKNTKGTAASIFKALAEAEINIRMIDQGSCELNIIIGVDGSDFDKAIQVLYAKLVK